MRPVTPEEFAALPLYKRVQHVRKGLEETQAQFAARLGVSERTIKGWENAAQKRGAPQETNAEKLAELSGYSTSLFMSPPALEVSMAEEISRKLDLLIVHLAKGRPMPGAEVAAALARLELTADAAEQSRQAGPRSNEGRR